VSVDRERNARSKQDQNVGRQHRGRQRRDTTAAEYKRKRWIGHSLEPKGAARRLECRDRPTVQKQWILRLHVEELTVIAVG
jgi:hypothetical protein